MNFETAREEMVDRLVSRGTVEHEATAEALRSVPRHEFVPADRREEAYRDRPLPIGNGQTISAPHMVGVMCDLLVPSLRGADDGDGASVLEVGTGCGYHAAVTAELLDDVTVYSVEYYEDLAEAARERLDDLGYDVRVRVDDGSRGWPENAPYDAAYLTCAPVTLPDPVVEQVRDGGVVVGPVGRRRQTLVRVRKAGDDREREEHGAVRFVTMQDD